MHLAPGLSVRVAGNRSVPSDDEHGTPRAVSSARLLSIQAWNGREISAHDASRKETRSDRTRDGRIENHATVLEPVLTVFSRGLVMVRREISDATFQPEFTTTEHNKPLLETLPFAPLGLAPTLRWGLSSPPLAARTYPS